MDLAPIIKRVQAKLGLTADGIAGPKTWSAIAAAVGADESVPAAPAVEVTDGIDSRSAATLATLRPIARTLAEKLILVLRDKGLIFKATSGFRTYEQQNDLYEQGRSKPGKIVTNARGGYSNHNFGLAFDLTLFEDGGPVYESSHYKVAGEVGKSLGLLWGGDWTSGDEPHFEFRPDWGKGLTESQALAEYRERVKNGMAIA